MAITTDAKVAERRRRKERETTAWANAKRTSNNQRHRRARHALEEQSQIQEKARKELEFKMKRRAQALESFRKSQSLKLEEVKNQKQGSRVAVTLRRRERVCAQSTQKAAARTRRHSKFQRSGTVLQNLVNNQDLKRDLGSPARLKMDSLCLLYKKATTMRVACDEQAKVVAKMKKVEKENDVGGGFRGGERTPTARKVHTLPKPISKQPSSSSSQPIDVDVQSVTSSTSSSSCSSPSFSERLDVLLRLEEAKEYARADVLSKATSARERLSLRRDHERERELAKKKMEELVLKFSVALSQGQEDKNA